MAIAKLAAVWLACAAAWSQTGAPVEKDALVMGFKLHYREAGRGPAVVLLHGIGADGSRWARNIGPLASEFHVIALDQIGFGQSDKPLANYHNGMLAEFLARFLGAVGIPKASLVGSSMGAGVALYTAAKYPALADKLILADGDTGPMAPKDPHQRQIQNGVTSDETREFMRLMFHNKSLVTEQAVEDNLALRLRSAYAIAKMQEAGDKGLGRLTEEQERSVRAPTLIIWGRYDELFDAAIADRLAKNIPGARKVFIEDAGHLPQLEKSDEFNRVVADFLRGSARRP